MLHLPVLSHFRFLLPLTAVCHTAFTCYFTNTSNILLDVRHGPIFTPIKLLCVSCEDPLSSPSDCYASIFGSLWLLGFPVSKSECWDASQHSKVTSACFSFSPSDLNLLDPYFISMCMHNNHCHWARAHLQLNLLLLLLLWKSGQFFGYLFYNCLFCRERAASTEIWIGKKLTVVWNLKTSSRGLFQRFIYSFSEKMCKKQ